MNATTIGTSLSNKKAGLFVVLATAMLMQQTISLSPISKMPFPARSRKASALFSSTLPRPNGLTSGNKQEESKEKGIAALEKLLARQQAETEETQRLLELYKAIDTSNATYGVQETEFMSVASSLMKGFDYGFVSRSEGGSFQNLKGGNEAFVGYGPPANVWTLGTQQFMRNLKAMINEYEDEEDIELTLKQLELRKRLEQLTLDKDEIWKRETADGPVEAPLTIKIPYLFLCWMLDFVFEGKYVPSRFFLLETVARMPYFSYIGMLHLYETLGFWRRSADMKRIHFSEELNEFRHLLIMESLGGDQSWWVRFMAQHSAIAYFIGLCFLWALSPSLSYKFSELLETHAVNTYTQFLDENEQELKELPPSLAAVDYYAFAASDPHYAEFQTNAITNNEEIRRPGLQMENLYDVFCAIRDDESDHVSTMEACLDPSVAKLSPSLERKVLMGIAAASAIAFFLNSGSPDLSVTQDFVDGVDFAAEDGVASGVVDAIMAGAAGIVSQIQQQDPGEDSTLADMLEEGMLLPNIRAFITEIASFFTRFF